ncbi:MAG: comEC [candidate division WS6 bacterium 34_10]|uniref:ComEC n=1 Tax=candidate division WS6 bacterium 34_10 TaxID=1641389 RepID=A0A101HJ45_9BACT|nr:MAG: comEC [candidate division WS6 bacterium 34_10]
MSSTTIILKIVKDFVFKNIINITFLILALYSFLFGSFGGSNDPEIIFFDVGQGDSILVQEGDFQVLVDGGPDDTVIFKLAKRMPSYDKNIEIVILTHPHEDHIRGLMNVLDEYSVERVFINKIEYENKLYEDLLEDYGELIAEVTLGDKFKYGDIEGEIIYPILNKHSDKYIQDKNINNESVVVLLNIKGKRTLLMGDAEREEEYKLLQEVQLGNIYILKAGHHCSKTATSDMFLRAADPSIAICSYGEGNKFGHPHYETIEKFKSYNVQYLETAKEGDIVIKFNDL